MANNVPRGDVAKMGWKRDRSAKGNTGRGASGGGVKSKKAGAALRTAPAWGIVGEGLGGIL